MDGNKKKRKRYGSQAQGSKGPLDGSTDEPMPLPHPMVGFNLPNQMSRPVDRMLPAQAIGPPYFYYENVALAPKGVWTTISRFLYDIQPEFVDSKYFCAAARKRGYIHNLPLENRSALLPIPPKTVFEAFPRIRKWWPSWDQGDSLITSRLVYLVQNCWRGFAWPLQIVMIHLPKEFRGLCWRSAGNGMSLGLG